MIGKIQILAGSLIACVGEFGLFIAPKPKEEANFLANGAHFPNLAQKILSTVL